MSQTPEQDAEQQSKPTVLGLDKRVRALEQGSSTEPGNDEWLAQLEARVTRLERRLA